MCRHDYLTITTDMKGNRAFTICMKCDRILEVINGTYFGVPLQDELGIIRGIKLLTEYKLSKLGL